MKKLITLITLFLSLILITTPLSASTKKEEAAIKKQIKLLESGLQTHNYQKIKKVVKKPYSNFCSFKRLDKLIGTSTLKKFNKNNKIKVKYINVYGNTANITLNYSHADCSSLYFTAHKWLYLDKKHSQNNYKKQVSKILNEWDKHELQKTRYAYGIIGNENFDVTMKKKKSKWIFESDPSGVFADMYSNGYVYHANITGTIAWSEW